MSIIGSRLKELRESRGWSKTLVANKLRLKQLSTYANWEYGLRVPDTEMITKLAELFDVPTDYLLGRELFNNGGIDPNESILKKLIEKYNIDLSNEENKKLLEKMIKIVFEDDN